MCRSPDPDHIQIQALDTDAGLQFLLGDNNDNLGVKEGSQKSGEIVWSRFIQRNESGGVYFDNVPVCGIVTRSFGILGSLKTSPDHQRKGYASLTMQFAFKELARSGLIPVTTVVPRNTPSIRLHEKLACKHAGMVDYVEVWPSLINRT